jgi:Xaa-Pro dipeptidase
MPLQGPCVAATLEHAGQSLARKQERIMIHSLYASHIAYLQQSWERALDAENLSAVLVHSGSPLVSFLDDYVYSFRANPQFLAWLPLTQHHDSVLLVQPGQKPQLWYYQPEDYWHVAPSDPESWWAGHFDVRIVSETDSWETAVHKLPGRIAALGDAPALQNAFPPASINPASLLMRLHLVRTRKTEYEIACMRQATEVACQAHLAARDAFMAGQSEYDIHLCYLISARQNDTELPYPSIVAVNEHAAVLHYQQRQRLAVTEFRSFLIDAGASHHAYAADITRTYAAHNGEFKDLVKAMDDLEVNLVGEVKPGVSYPALHLRAHTLIAEVLRHAGITRLSAEDAASSGLSSVFFPHGLGHFIGLQTHDVAGLADNAGNALERPEGHPYLRLTRTLEPGNVLTIEPGLYFIPALLAAWKLDKDPGVINWDVVERLSPYGGIRIEDNVHVTESGCENLTRHAFAKL